jgi:nuclear transport factor 2 (NTF2) superfamily protein
MSQTKEARNKRIVRLRNAKRSLSWRKIAERIAVEYPDEAVSWQRCRDIYRREAEGIEEPGTVYQRKHGINYRKQTKASSERD